MIKKILSLLIIILLLSSCAQFKISSAYKSIDNENYLAAKNTIDEILIDSTKNNYSDYYLSEVYYLLGIAEGGINNFDKMMSHFNKSESLSDEFSEDIYDAKEYYWLELFDMGVDAYNEEEYRKAKNYFEYSFKINPFDDEAMENYLYSITALWETEEFDQTKNDSSSIGLEKDYDLFNFIQLGSDYEDIIELLSEYNVEVVNKIENYKVAVVYGFDVLNKNSILSILFYKNQVYEIDAYNTVTADLQGVVNYFLMAEILNNKYGKTPLIIYGEEKEGLEERVQDLKTGELSYQYSWNGTEYDLTFSLSNSNDEFLICSINYSLKNGDK